jgi:hypothetical protein
MNDIELLENSSTVVGDCGALGTSCVDQLVHTSGAQSRANDVNDGLASIDVANKLSNTLRGIGTFFEKDNTRLLRSHSTLVSRCTSPLKQRVHMTPHNNNNTMGHLAI